MPRVPADQRKRRTTEQVRNAILTAATAEFAEHGFDRATTRQIARTAGVAEPMIYRAFTTKKGLYDAAVRAPMNHFSQAFAAQWLQDDAIPVEDVLGRFARELYSTVRANRLVFAALSGQDMLAAATDAPLAELEEVSRLVKERFKLRWDPKIATRAAVTLVVGMALWADAFFPDGKTSEDEIVQELTNMLIGAAGIERPPS